MSSLNRAEVIGNLGRDAELRFTSSGEAVTTVSLATQEVWKDKDGKKQERTEWHRIVIWGKQAENLAQYLTKGKKIYADGRIQSRKWKDKDGTDKYTTEIVANRVILLGSPSGSGSSSHGQDGDPGYGADDGTGGVDDSDIPF